MVICPLSRMTLLLSCPRRFGPHVPPTTWLRDAQEHSVPDSTHRLPESVAVWHNCDKAGGSVKVTGCSAPTSVLGFPGKHHVQQQHTAVKKQAWQSGLVSACVLTIEIICPRTTHRAAARPTKMAGCTRHFLLYTRNVTSGVLYPGL